MNDLKCTTDYLKHFLARPSMHLGCGSRRQRLQRAHPAPAGRAADDGPHGRRVLRIHLRLVRGLVLCCGLHLDVLPIPATHYESLEEAV